MKKEKNRPSIGMDYSEENFVKLMELKAIEQGVSKEVAFNEWLRAAHEALNGIEFSYYVYPDEYMIKE